MLNPELSSEEFATQPSSLGSRETEVIFCCQIVVVVVGRVVSHEAAGPHGLGFNSNFNHFKNLVF